MAFTESPAGRFPTLTVTDDIDGCLTVVDKETAKTRKPSIT